MEHKLKILPQYFEAVQSGTKTFEIRKNDRGFKVGDTLLLKEYETDYSIGDSFQGYTGQEITKEITHILEGGQYGLEEGYCILGLKDTEKVSIEDYKEILEPFMLDLESELKGFKREFDFDFAIRNLIKRYENQRESLRDWGKNIQMNFKKNGGIRNDGTTRNHP